jgi:chromosome segregation ATPase
MADTLEKRVQDLEYIMAHLPDDLDARFAGVDVKLAMIRESQTRHTADMSGIKRDVSEIRNDLSEIKDSLKSLIERS